MEQAQGLDQRQRFVLGLLLKCQVSVTQPCRVSSNRSLL